MENKLNDIQPKKNPLFASLAILFALLFVFAFFMLFNKSKSFSADGIIVADTSSSQVASPINGTIDKILVKDGQKVKFAQALFTINTDKIDKIIKGKPIKARYYSNSQIEILPPVPTSEIMISSRNTALSSRGENEVQSKQQEVKPQETAANYQELYNQGVISKKELEAFNLKLARQKENLSEIEPQVNGDNKKTKAPDINQSFHSKLLATRMPLQFSSPTIIFKKKTVFAPMDGVIKMQSNYSSGDTVKSKEIILSIIQPPKLFADIKINNKNISDIHLNQCVIFKPKNLPGSILGNVMSIKISEDKSNSYTVRIKPDEKSSRKTFTLIPQLKTGMNVVAAFGKT